MTPNERLTYLLSYHHNLTLQLQCAESSHEKEKLNNSLGNLEVQIESILFSEAS